jgi:hypothetical protein
LWRGSAYGGVEIDNFDFLWFDGDWRKFRLHSIRRSQSRSHYQVAAHLVISQLEFAVPPRLGRPVRKDLLVIGRGGRWLRWVVTCIGIGRCLRKRANREQKRKD